MHPVRMKITQALLRNKEQGLEGLTPLEMVRILEDVPQATLYRHLQALLDANIIRVFKEEKVRAVSEKYYEVNENELKLNQSEWEHYSKDEKLDYFTFYQLLLKSHYEAHLNKKENEGKKLADASFSLVELQLDKDGFKQFQNDLQELILRYYGSDNQEKKEQETAYHTVGITMIPDT